VGVAETKNWARLHLPADRIATARQTDLRMVSGSMARHQTNQTAVQPRIPVNWREHRAIEVAIRS
jgi:hypothetical protein